MTPQEKSEELVNKYLLATPTPFYIDDAKKCAFIAVDEVLNTMWEYHLEAEWWQEVKQEIEKI